VIEGDFKDLDDQPSEKKPRSPKSSDPKSSPWRK